MRALIGLILVLAPLACHAQAPAAARADALQITEQAERYELSVPVSKLSMSLPKDGMSQARTRAGGATSHPRYFYFEDAATGLVASGWFEPAQGFRGIKQFWESETTEWSRKGLPQAREVAFERVGNWETVIYDTLSPRGTNSHVRAHWLQAGTWIDLHVSLTSDRTSAESRAALLSFLRRVEVKEKR